ncbi:M20/M25/M40 family metallo-hydrolase [Congregibacter sp.]|jgi:hypothetical protein|uniref:M20/M25/M40 family metallo-hydrolase n=1 Tax=Congregibacter sp. TaxID=2744308 RepID=UPI0039E54BCC
MASDAIGWGVVYTRSFAFGTLLLLLLAPSQRLLADESVDLAAVSKIRQHAAKNAEVKQTLRVLSDVYGPRLTGTPRYLEMAQWVEDKLRAWGIENVYLESFGQGLRGWEVINFRTAMTRPVFMVLDAQPVCCSDSTSGTVTGTPLVVDFTSMQALRSISGQLRGRILLHPDVQEVADSPGTKWTPAQLAKAAARMEPVTPEGLDGPGSSETYADRLRDQARNPLAQNEAKALAQLMIDEGVSAVLRSSSAPPGLVNNRFDTSMVEFVRSGDPRPVPMFVIPREQHARMLTLIEMQQEPLISLELNTRYYEDPATHVNVIAEIPGSDPEHRNEVVYLGAHLDSVEMATGAADNGIGAATSMEVMRILSELDLRPRRTIRLALWGGEEYGLLGARAHAEARYGDIIAGTVTPEQESVSAYFNHDNNGHDIRGIFLLGNEATRPVFEAYLAPYADEGANTVTIENACCTDLVVFDALGIPSFEWIHDAMDYFSHQLHTSTDAVDLIDFESVRRNTAIITSTVYLTAMRNQALPRKSMPAKPFGTLSVTSRDSSTRSEQVSHD